MKIENLNKDTFELFLFTVLRQKAAEEKKRIYFEYRVPKSFYDVKRFGEIYLDAFAPEGMLGIDGPVAFEFKLNISKEAIDRYVKHFHQYFNNRTSRITLVFITNSSYKQIWGFLEDVDYYNYLNIKVLTRETIEKWLEEYPIDFSNALLYYDKDFKFAAELVLEHNGIEYLEKSKEKSLKNLEVLKTELLNNENFALVLGSGVSIDMGALSWGKLLEYFEKTLKSRNIVMDTQLLTKKVGNSNLITAQVCKDLYDRYKLDFYWDLHQGLYRNRKAAISQEMKEIVRIVGNCLNKKHFRILTYNFDNYLEQALGKKNIQYNTLYCSENLNNNDLSIYHVHGFLPEVSSKRYIQSQHKKSIFLTEENYNDLFNQPYIWQISSQLSFFRENTCLFLGCGLTDPNIRRLLDLTKHKNKKHYAIMVKDGLTARDLKTATDHFAKLNIEIIWVDTSQDIVHILNQL